MITKGICYNRAGTTHCVVWTLFSNTDLHKRTRCKGSLVQQ